MRLSPLALLVALALLLSLDSLAGARPPDSPSPARALPELAGRSYFSDQSLTSEPAKSAAVDTFTLYGGSGRDEGKFQDSLDQPDWQGWVGVDLTDPGNLPRWQVSTFNAENLNDHGAGNHAYWCGYDELQAPDWSSPPGYGHSWNESLVWSSGPLSDPSQGQTVQLELWFNHDTEPGYDFLFIEHDSAGAWTPVLKLDGTNQGPGIQFRAPGVHFPDDLSVGSIVYAGDDYPEGEIRLRLRFESDGAWSDEDGLWPTTAGAAQVDDLRVSWVDGGAPQESFEDLEGPGPYDWTYESGNFVGDFAKIFPQYTDIDPCHENTTPQISFIDDGTPPSNGGGVSTGGSTSPNWSYGPGGYVVNYTGGLSDGTKALRDQVWSPPMAWDLPGVEDDGIEGGARLRFDVFRHFPLSNGMFYEWGVRSSTDGGASWSPWRNLNRVYYEFIGYFRDEYEIGPLLEPGLTHLQVALGVWDMADIFMFPGNDSTPAPYFDNVHVVKYPPGGPRIEVEARYLFQDSFPNSGSLDFLADANALSCRMDMAADVLTSWGPEIVHGDSIVADVVPMVPGTTIQQTKLHWKLDVNPLFASVREMPPGTTVLPGTAPNGWDQWQGEVLGQQSTTSTGTPVPDRWFFDMPYDGPPVAAYQTDGPENMFFPGDILYFYLEAIDDGAHVTTLPADISQWGTAGHPRDFTARALPMMFSNGMGGVAQPHLLVINDNGHGSHVEKYVWALQHNWIMEHSTFGTGAWAFDLYTVRAPALAVSNGIGAAGACGATAEQLAGYGTILYLSGNQTHCVLTTGTEYPGLWNDKSDDIGLLDAWHALDGKRCIAYFGDSLAYALQQLGEPASQLYLEGQMGIDAVEDDVLPMLGGTRTPYVYPESFMWFAEDFEADADCPLLRNPDALWPWAGAVATHRYSPYPYPSGEGFTAAVAYDRLVNGYRKVDLTFGFALESVTTMSGDWISASRVRLIEEILSYFSHSMPPFPPPTGTDTPSRGVWIAGNSPNPFNPRTALHFAVGRAADYRVDIYDLRGRRIVTLHEGRLEAGPQEMIWTGVDEHGRSVASGVYVARIEGDGQLATHKMALVR